MLIIMLLTVTGLQAQITIDGRRACYDALTNTFLTTVPEQAFQRDTLLAVATDDDCLLMSIDGQAVTDNVYRFDNITADKTYSIEITRRDGQTTASLLQFTFLPLIQLQGTFHDNYENGTFLYCSPDLPATETLTARIKWRGGTTNVEGKHKRNYKVKFGEDHRFLDMRNDNNWILDAGQADVFRLRNRVAMDIWNDIDSRPYYADREPKARNGVSGRVVEVFLNNEYQGIYNFSENLDRKQMKVVKADSVTGAVHGCLYKVKHFGYGNMNDTVGPYDNHSETWEHIEVKYPDLNDNDTTDWKTLYDALNFVTFASDDDFAAHVSDYFDLPVVVDISIFIGLVNGLDNRGKNIFWAVYDKEHDKKLTPAPWDLDCTTGQEWVSEDIRGPEILFDWEIGLTNRLTANNVLHFNDQLNSRYKQLRQQLLTDDYLIGKYTSYYSLIKQSGAARRETRRWSGDSDVRGEEIDFDKEINYITDWLTVHMEWLDNAWFPLDAWYDWYESTGIDDSLLRQSHLQPQGLYTISGVRLPFNDPAKAQLKPGLYIYNGRKIRVR